MAGSAALKGAAPVFAALGDETRLRLVSRLCAGGPASIARLTAASSVTRSTRRGRERVWELRPRQFLQARESLDAISRQWDEALGRLKAFVKR